MGNIYPLPEDPNLNCLAVGFRSREKGGGVAVVGGIEGENGSLIYGAGLPTKDASLMTT